ncbi:hypothetical protein AB0945_06205 [Streptomyces sp. NPDC005474]|uniref:hypothetical protein n=1 Tax=Streptomyces sp. NPDC005474 TaxID=3154878 RepID=UPI003455A765
MTAVASAAHTGVTPVLRRLYVTRFVFAAVWAALLVLAGPGLTVGVKVLLFLYPVFDVAAAVVDARSDRTRGPLKGLYVNIAVSSIAAVGLAVAGSASIAAVLRVWGAWAVFSGLVQLAVGVARRPMGGQWVMILSGGISVLAGVGFIRSAAQDSPTLVPLAGYAVLGGIFFLVSASRLPRASRGQ